MKNRKTIKYKIVLDKIYNIGDEKAYFVEDENGYRETINSQYILPDEKNWKTILGAINYIILNNNNYDKFYIILPDNKRLTIQKKKLNNKFKISKNELDLLLNKYKK